MPWGNGEGDEGFRGIFLFLPSSRLSFEVRRQEITRKMKMPPDPSPSLSS
jgi:hypothetical protein